MKAFAAALALAFLAATVAPAVALAAGTTQLAQATGGSTDKKGKKATKAHKGGKKGKKSSGGDTTPPPK